jgi:hypothetical protein
MLWRTGRSVRRPLSPLGPSFFFYKGLTSDGVYASLLLVWGLALWLLLAIERRLVTGSPATLHLASLGWLLGLAWWILPISAFMAAAAAVAMVAGATRAWLGVRGLGALVAAFLLGGLPLVVAELGKRVGEPSRLRSSPRHRRAG